MGLYNTSAPIPRGTTMVSGERTELLGTVCEFQDLDYSAAGPVKTKRSGFPVKCILVKNDSGGALLPKTCVKFSTDAGEYGLNVANEADTGDTVHGVVDEFLPAAGVANGEAFWLVVRGPSKVISDGNGVIAVGAKLMGIGSGTGKVRGRAAESDVDDFVGTAMEGATNVDGTVFKAYIQPLIGF